MMDQIEIEKLEKGKKSSFHFSSDQGKDYPNKNCHCNEYKKKKKQEEMVKRRL